MCMTALVDSTSHGEIPYDNQTRAQKFHEAAFGWQITKLSDMDYYWITATETDSKTMMPTKPGAINGGMLQRPHPDAKPTIVVNVESVDDHLKKVAAAGGSVVFPKIPVGSYGFYAQISDTEGNTIGIWQTAFQ